MVRGSGASHKKGSKDVKNYLTPAVQITAKRPMVQTNADLQLATKLFSDRWLDKLWGR